MAAITLERLHSLTDDHVAQLSSVLLDCVDGGASVGFMQPLSLDQAFAFWQRVAAGVLAGERALLVARDDVGIVGTSTTGVGPAGQPKSPGRPVQDAGAPPRPTPRPGCGADAWRVPAGKKCWCWTRLLAARPSVCMRG